MVMSLRNKKGDVTISTIILIVLGLVVLVMLIIGFTKGTGFFFDLFDSGPSELQTLGKACVLYAQGSLTIDFCNYKLIKLDGKDKLINCRYNGIRETLAAGDVNINSGSLACSDATENARARAACSFLVPNEEKRKTTQVNSRTGELVTCSNLGSSLLGTCTGTPTPGPSGAPVADCNTYNAGPECTAAGCSWTPNP